MPVACACLPRCRCQQPADRLRFSRVCSEVWRVSRRPGRRVLNIPTGLCREHYYPAAPTARRGCLTSWHSLHAAQPLLRLARSDVSSRPSSRPHSAHLQTRTHEQYPTHAHTHAPSEVEKRALRHPGLSSALGGGIEAFTDVEVSTVGAVGGGTGGGRQHGQVPSRVVRARLRFSGKHGGRGGAGWAEVEVTDWDGGGAGEGEEGMEFDRIFGKLWGIFIPLHPWFTVLGSRGCALPISRRFSGASGERLSAESETPELQYNTCSCLAQKCFHPPPFGSLGARLPRRFLVILRVYIRKSVRPLPPTSCL